MSETPNNGFRLRGDFVKQTPPIPVSEVYVVVDIRRKMRDLSRGPKIA